jgi:hypothetical protein
MISNNILCLRGAIIHLNIAPARPSACAPQGMAPGTDEMLDGIARESDLAGDAWRRLRRADEPHGIVYNLMSNI